MDIQINAVALYTLAAVDQTSALRVVTWYDQVSHSFFIDLIKEVRVHRYLANLFHESPSGMVDVFPSFPTFSM